jgi:hypothetical protein
VLIPEYDFAANARAVDKGMERYFENGTKVVHVSHECQHVDRHVLM